MKKRKILVLFPFLGLLLSGCTFQEALGNVKDWTTGHILDPIKNLINGGEKEEKQDEDEHKEDEGGETEVTIRYIELEDYPHEVIQNKVIEPKDVSIKVFYSDQTDKTEHPDEVICDTSKVGETDLVAKFKGEECSGKVIVKEAPITEHAGTEEDPFTGKDAVTIAQSLPESSKDDKHPSDQSYYIKGVVGALLEEFNPSFGNFTFKIEEDFEGYRLKFGPNYTPFKNATDLEVGDTVTMYAQILNFKGTYETSGGYITKIEKPAIEANLTEITIEGNPQTTYLAGAAYNHDGLSVIAHYDNGETQDITLAATWEISKATAEMGDESIKITAHYKEVSAELVVNVTVQDSSTTHHAGTEEDPYDGYDAVIVAGKLASGQATENSYYIKGKVINFEENFNPTYGNYSFKIEGGFIGWRLKNGPEFKLFEEGDLQVGDTVTMYAQIQAYGNDCKPETKGGYIVSIDRPIVNVESVSLDRNELNMEVGVPDETLVATVLPENATNKAVEWVSANPEVATVNDGVVHAVAAGETTVTVTSVADPTKSATCSVTVSEQTKELVSVQIKTMPKVEYTEGEKLDLLDLVLTLYYSDQSTQDVTTGYTTNIALDHELTTDDTELIITYGEFALQPITLTVTAKPQPTHAGTAEDPYTGEDAVIVANNLAAGGVTEASYYIKGKVLNFEENFNPTYGNYSFKIEGGFIGWRLKNGPEFALFNEGDLEIGDTVTMYVQIQSYIKNAGDTPKPESKNGYIVSIEKPVIAVQSIELSEQHLDLEVGQQAALSANVLPENATNKEVTWSVSSESVKYEEGKVVALAVGEATVTATSVADPTVSASCTVTVSEPTKELLSLSITGEPTKLAYYHGEAYDPTGLTVMAQYNIGDDEDVTSSVTIVADKETASYGDTSVKFTASYGEKSVEASFAVTVEYKKGSEQLPYTVEEARAAIDGTESGKTAYVKGIVSRIAYAWANNSMSFYFSDDGSTNNEIEAYRLAATADPGVEVGDLVVVKGQLTKYNTTYELNTGCTLESLTKATVETVTISGTPQTDYTENDKYNHNGLVATAHLNTGLDIDVTNNATWAFSKETAEQGDSEISITATYKGVSSTALVVQVNVEAQGQAVEKTVSWTASAGNNLGSQISAVGGTATGTISTGDFSWNYTRTLVNLKSGKSDYIAMQGNTWIQLGSGSALESLEFSTSAIPGKIKSITVVAATAGTHTLTVEVGDTKYLDKATLTTYSNNASATNPDPANCAVTGTGTASGAIKITLASSATTTNKAVLIRSITVVYEA